MRPFRCGSTIAATERSRCPAVPERAGIVGRCGASARRAAAVGRMRGVQAELRDVATGFWRDDVPDTDLEPIEPGSELPGRLVALYDGRGRNETPLWLPEQRALAFADALTAPAGELRVWWTPWHEERALPALRALLELPFERVIVSHGEPVHDRSAYERALERPPWGR